MPYVFLAAMLLRMVLGVLSFTRKKRDMSTLKGINKQKAAVNTLAFLLLKYFSYSDFTVTAVFKKISNAAIMLGV